MSLVAAVCALAACDDYVSPAYPSNAVSTDPVALSQSNQQQKEETQAATQAAQAVTTAPPAPEPAPPAPDLSDARAKIAPPEPIAAPPPPTAAPTPAPAPSSALAYLVTCHGNYAGTYDTSAGPATVTQSACRVDVSYPRGTMTCAARGSSLDCSWQEGSTSGKATFEHGSDGAWTGSAERGPWTFTRTR